MADHPYKLSVSTPLNGFSTTIGDTSLVEVTNCSIVSIAAPVGGEAALGKKLKSKLGSSWPAAGDTNKSKNGSLCLLGLQSDLIFAIEEKAESSNLTELPSIQMKTRLGETAYLTDQSGAWCMLRLSGPNAISALERICQLDLHTDAFAIGNCARTSMEHMNAITVRESAHQFLLLSASSSAEDFCHAVAISLENVDGEG